MIKYLHIMGTGNIRAIQTYSDFINENFNQDEHHFLIIGHQDLSGFYPANMTCLEKYNFNTVLSWITRSKYVFLHALFLSTSIKLFLLFMHLVQKKIVWVSWGKDLYEDNWTNSFFGRIKRIIDHLFKTKVKYFVGIFPPDIEYYKKLYGHTAKTFFAPIVAGKKTLNKLYTLDPMIRTIKRKLDADETINILIGHQANPLLGHKQVIDWLIRFLDKNIQIYIPISYGNKSYANEVANYALDKLGQKVTLIRELMDFDSYMDLLRQMDIAIFHIDRQIGLGNLYPLLYMQKKIYLRSTGVMYPFYKNYGIEVQKSEDIENITYEELVKDVDMSKASESVMNLNDINRNIQRWNAVFTELIMDK